VKITVVVCAHAHERIPKTRLAISSVLGGSRTPDEVLLILDGDEALEHALRTELPAAVTSVPNAGRGISDARNTALAAASGEVVAFIDDDAWVDDSWLATIERAFLSSAVLGVGGRVVPDWEDPRVALPEELYWIVGSTYKGHRTDRGPMTRPIGANMAARRDALIAVGGFSAAFGPQGGVKVSSNEELATFAALADAFGPNHVWYEPAAVTHHYAPAARCTFRYLVHRSAVEGRSKADVRTIYGARSMAHDRSYARSVIIPGVAHHVARGVVHFDRRELGAGIRIAAAAAIAAGGYLARRSRALLRPAVPTAVSAISVAGGDA